MERAVPLTGAPGDGQDRGFEFGLTAEKGRGAGRRKGRAKSVINSKRRQLTCLRPAVLGRQKKEGLTQR